jgi:hypothetical protein
MRKLPFVHVPKLRHVTLGSENAGKLWLLERGGITPSENPIDIQQHLLNQQKIAKIYKTATQKLAKARGVSISEARKLMQGLSVKEADGKTTVEIDDDPVSFEDWLSPEELAELIQLGGDSVSLEIRVATLFIRHRVLYPVFLAAPATAGATTMHVKPLTMPIMAGDRIDFEDFKVEVTEFADYEAEVIQVAKVPGKLKADAFGFLMDGGKKKAGCFSSAITPATFDLFVEFLITNGVSRVEAENKVTEFLRSKEVDFGWMESETKQLDNAIIHDIYRLYCREKGEPDPDLVAEVDEDAEAEAELLMGELSLSEGKSRSQSNGKASLTDSAGLALVTSG